MQPIKLEIFLDDKTLAGMQSVEGNMVGLEQTMKLVISRLEEEISDMQAKFKQAMSQGITDQQGLADIQALQGAIERLKAELKELEVQKKRTNETPIMSDDPAPKLNNVKMSMQQIARELPALAMGPQMFFLAISNNIPMFTDAVGNARKEYERLTAAGQKATPVWKQLLSSLFSWQTMMATAITLTVVYGKEIGEWTKSLFKVKDATLELLSAEQEMALSRSKASESIKKEQVELDVLYAKLKNVSTSTQERTAATNEWIKRNPEYANILSGENLNLSKLEIAYKALSKEIYANAIARQYAEKMGEIAIKQEKEEIRRLNQKLTIAKAEQEYAKLTAEYKKKEEDGFGTATAKLDAQKKIEKARKNVEEQKSIYTDLENNIENYGKNITSISNHIKAADLFPQPNEGTFDYWTQQKGRAEGVLKSIESNIKETLDAAAKEGKDLFSLGIDKSVVETYKKAITEVNEAKKQLKIYDDKDQKTTGKTKTDYENELADARIRVQQKIEAARIAIMVEGCEKRKTIAKKDYGDSLAAIDKEERDTLAKLEKSKKAGKKVTPKEEEKVKSDAQTQRTLAQVQYMETSYNLEKEWREKNQQAWIDYNKEYGTAQEKRLAIVRDYSLKIGQAETEGEKASLRKKRDEDLKEYDFNEFKKTVNLAEIFGNLDEQSMDGLTVLRDKLKGYINGAAKSLRPSDLKELQGALTQIDLKIVDRKPWLELKSSLKDYETSQASVEKAQTELNAVMKGGEVIVGTYTDETGKIITKLLTQEKAEKNLADAQNNRQQKQSVLAQSMQGAAAEMAAYGQAASDVLNMLEGFGVKVDENVKGVIEGFGSMAEGVDQIAQSLKSGNIAGMISGIAKTVSGVVKTIGSIFAADWGGEQSKRRYEQAKEKYESYMAVLDKVIAKQKELVASMETSDFANADNSYKKARDLLKKQQDYAREMGKAYLDSGASNGFLGIGSSSSEGIKQQEGISESAWAQARKVLGGNFDKATDGRMTGLFDLTYEQLVKLRDEASGFWGELHEDTQNYLNQIIESEEAWQKVQETRKEALTKTDFEGFYNSFVSMLSDMDATSEDFADSFEKYLQKAILSSLVANKYKDKIQSLYNSWADMSDGNGLSSTEVDKLRDDYQKIIEKMLKEREQMMNDFGWTSSEEETSSQSGRSGAFETISQEQGTKLEGLFTSLQDHASGMHKLLNDLKKGRDADHELWIKIADNTAYCKLLEDIYNLMTRQERDGYITK